MTRGDTCMGTWGVRGDAYRGVAGGTLLSLERSTYMGRGNGCSRVVHTEGRGWHTSLAREEYIHFSRKGGVHTWRRGNGEGRGWHTSLAREEYIRSRDVVEWAWHNSEDIVRVPRARIAGSDGDVWMRQREVSVGECGRVCRWVGVDRSSGLVGECGRDSAR